MPESSSLVSIIVCTKNRADSLKKTLECISRVSVPDGVTAEFLVVDNGSKDDTPLVIESSKTLFQDIRLIPLFEPKPGKSRALNRALSVARGDVILFTDDDVLPPPNWISGMCEPLWSDIADAVAGGIKLGPQIAALDLAISQRVRLATTEHCERSHDPPLIGANRAISRRVLEVVPWFDPEMGPGAVGYAEDTLFWLQIRAAKLRIVARYDVCVEHNPDPSRASRRAMAHLMTKGGEFDAYMDHHWNQNVRRHPYLALVRALLILWWARIRNLREWIFANRLPTWEMEPLEKYHFRRRHLIERKRPANYDQFGLIKRAGILPTKQNFQRCQQD